MLLVRAAAVIAVLAVTATASGPRVLASWPALLLIAYLAALAGCVAHHRARRSRPTNSSRLPSDRPALR
ncbi:hypothetical protein [Micromonospora sp. CPCC 206061]|uniref:hypothetical protein n=1 Tax=Micromonospora sp. CPCC 206061 TaxID=3122410 RepID=UPI002FF23EC6